MADAESVYEGLLEALPAIRWLPEECWIVGGSVRDMLLGLDPRDVDCAAPRAADAAATFVARTGGRAVCLAREPLETWRVILTGLEWDFTDIDGPSIETDLARRDFTIGAVALSVRKPNVLLDPYGGVKDVESGLVRMVSAANLLSDPVRMIRAVRLAGRLGFRIENETRAVIAENASRVKESAPERVTTEMDAIVTSRDVRRALELLRELCLDGVVLPFELTGEDVRRCAGTFSPDAVTRYAALFVGRARDVEAHAIEGRWSRDRRRDVTALLSFVDAASGQAGGDPLPMLVHDHGVRAARRATELLAVTGEVELAQRLGRLVRERGAALEDMRPLLDGVAVREVSGIEDGPELGRVLRRLVEAQVRGVVRTRPEAVEFVRRLVERA